MTYSDRSGNRWILEPQESTVYPYIEDRGSQRPSSAVPLRTFRGPYLGPGVVHGTSDPRPSSKVWDLWVVPSWCGPSTRRVFCRTSTNTRRIGRVTGVISVSLSPSRVTSTALDLGSTGAQPSRGPCVSRVHLSFVSSGGLVGVEVGREEGLCDPEGRRGSDGVDSESEGTLTIETVISPRNHN